MFARGINWVLGAVVFLILADSVACPRVTHDRMQVEAAVIAAIRTIHTAQTQYYSTSSHYAGSLRELAAAGILEAQLATGKQLGYNFVIDGTKDGYTVRAWPFVFNGAGLRTFYSDQTMTVHERRGPEPASVQDPEMK
jgi:hypothetical protein